MSSALLRSDEIALVLQESGLGTGDSAVPPGCRGPAVQPLRAGRSTRGLVIAGARRTANEERSTRNLSDFISAELDLKAG